MSAVNQNVSSFDTSYYFHYHRLQNNIPYQQLYIDSRDVILMILGIKDFYKGMAFDEKLLAQDGILMHSLIFGEWLGSFQLLIPHQDELLFNLNRFSKIYDKTTEKEKNEFLHHIEELTGLHKDSFSDDSTPEEIIKKISAKGKDLYKAQYILNKPDWKQRLKHLHSSKILDYDRQKHDFEAIAKTELFRKLKTKGFDKIRPRNPKLNVVDTLVLCVLHEKLEKHKQDNSFPLPIYYDPQQLFIKVIEKCGVEDLFSIPIIKGRQLNIIQDTNFFLIQALLSKEKEIEPLVSEENLKDYEEFKKISNKINQNISSDQSIEISHLKAIQEFIDTKFIKVFWVERDKDAIDFVQNLIKYLKKDEVQTHLNQEIEDVQNGIRNRIESYTIFRDTYYAVETAWKAVEKSFTSNLGRHSELNVFTVFALTRFSILPETCGDVQELANSLFLRHNDEDLSWIISTIVENVSKGLELDDRRKLGIGIAILWIFEEYNLIVRILEKLELKYAYYSQALFHAASITKIRSDQQAIKDVVEILNCIESHEESYVGQFTIEKNYKLAIGVSYIYYNLWRSNRNEHFLSNLDEPKPLKDNNQIDKLLINLA